ncbi:MAG TPA: hypothetical protein VFD46_11300 [Chryseolinea sp.]|nr:hypothetical protein [Chryseolinea sp.]
METFKGNRILAKINRTKQKYDEQVAELETYLRDVVDFEFKIDYQPSDGHMLCNHEDGEEMHIAPLVDCLSVIYSKGKLSYKDHRNLCV